MKLKAWPLPKPAPTMCRVALVYGPDQGMVGERGRDIAKQTVPDLTDPFTTATLTMNDIMLEPMRFWDEVSATSLMGGDRLLWIRDADDKLTPLLKSYLEDPNAGCFVLLEAGDLGTKSPLRALCEKAETALSVACYVEEEQDLSREISRWVSGEGYSISSDALQLLSANIRGDRAIARREVEKLVTYMVSAQQRAIREQDVLAVASDTRAESTDMLLMAVASGYLPKALGAWQTLKSEGTSAVLVLRSLQSHFRKLYQARLLHENEHMSFETALNQLQPKIFFKNIGPMNLQLKRWTLRELEAALHIISDCEAHCKRSHTVPETLTGWCLLALTRKQPQLWVTATHAA